MDNQMKHVGAAESEDRERARSSADGGPQEANIQAIFEIFDGVDMAPRCIAGALNSIELVAARLRSRGDPRAVFPDVYAVITRRVKAVIEGASGPSFLEPAWISHLAGLFCEHYLKALSASLAGAPQASEAWAIAFDACDNGGSFASLDALFGINAHINFDLAQGLYDNITAHDAAGDRRLVERYRHDHDLVNGILEASMPEILSILSTGYQCPLASLAARSKGLEEASTRVVVFALQRWRDRVWGHLLEMLEADGPRAIALVVARMDRSSTRIARALLISSAALSTARQRRRGGSRALPLAA